MIKFEDAKPVASEPPGLSPKKTTAVAAPVAQTEAEHADTRASKKLVKQPTLPFPTVQS